MNSIKKTANIYLEPETLVKDHEITMTIELHGKTLFDHFKQIHGIIEKNKYSKYRLTCIYFSESQEITGD